MNITIMNGLMSEWEHEWICDDFMEQIGRPIYKLKIKSYKLKCNLCDEDEEESEEDIKIFSRQYVRNKGKIKYINGKYEIHYDKIKKKIVDFPWCIIKSKDHNSNNWEVEYYYSDEYYAYADFCEGRVCDI